MKAVSVSVGRVLRMERAGNDVIVVGPDPADVLLRLKGAAALRAYALLQAQDEPSVDNADFNCHAAAQHVVLGRPLQAYYGRKDMALPDIDVPLSVASVRAAVDALCLPCILQVRSRDDDVHPSMRYLHSAVLLGVAGDGVPLILNKAVHTGVSVEEMDVLRPAYPNLASRLRFYGEPKRR